MLIRLNKYLADCGLASRRKAEELILAGKIKVNNKIITELGTKIDPSKDKIYCQNKPVQLQKFIYIMLNKPKGYTCTTKKFKKEKRILDLIKIKEKIFPVGRLDKNSQGLIFLTNDGDWAHQLTHPKFQVEKEYQVKTTKPIKEQDLKKMEKGLQDESDLLKIKNYKINSPTSVNLILTQGHKREIRRLFEHFKYPIKQLKRIKIDKWQLGDLSEGKWQYFQPK
ncbi:MAG TPA: rRNA pseudouridine synthase [Candidatus Uhrbacteria bacterium]|nr:rRNA pseudouridine synthase [Candidatus Uhrbacteria bacterium]